MELNLKDLETGGGIYTGLPEKEVIEWDGVEYEIYVKKLPFGEIERIMKSESYTTALIAAGIRLGKDGKESLTYDQVSLLKPELARKFANAVNKVNVPKKKNLPTKTDSGVTSSATALEEKQ